MECDRNTATMRMGFNRIKIKITLACSLNTAAYGGIISLFIRGVYRGRRGRTLIGLW
jgi:hypothetical protein